MKKILFFLAFALLGAQTAHAISMDVWLSSNTATADTAQTLCNQQNQTRHGVLHGVCVNTGAAGTFTVYNASSTAANPIAAINTAAVVPCMFYDVMVSSGLVYTNSATANVTVLYQCY